MISQNIKPVFLTLCLSASVMSGAVHAQPAKSVAAAGKPVINPATSVSLLGGKLAFMSPAGYEASDLPRGSVKDDTAGTTGRLFVNKGAKRAIIATEAPSPSIVSDTDRAFLAGAVDGFEKQQRQALPDYKKTGETSFTANAVGVHQVDSTVTMGGIPAHKTTFLAGSGKKLAVVQVLTNANDVGHDELVEEVRQSMQAAK